MGKYGHIFLSVLILTAVAVGAYRAADSLQYSLFTYQSPLSVIRLAPGEQMPPQTERVVIVVISGLDYAMARSVDMPNLERAFEAGASAVMDSQPPTYPLPAWTALLTGVWPDLNNVPILEAGKVSSRPIVFDHFFAAARDAGLRTAIAGFEGWKSLLPADTVNTSVYVSREDAIGDAQAVQAALAFIADPQYNLILVHLGQVEAAGRTEGVYSIAYASAAYQVDSYLRQILRLADMSHSVLIVTSDHGLLENGRLGGSEPDLTRLPFVMIGQDVIPGAYSSVQQVDLAPTAAALLGTRLPTAAQGRPLYEMLQLKKEPLTRGQLQVAAQKVALGDAYLRVMGEDGLNRAIRQDLDNAQRALLDGNQAGALELAKLIAKEATAEMASVKATHIARERLSRLGGVIAGVWLLLIFFWARRGPHYLVSLAAACVAVALYYGIYLLRGYTFSLSSIDVTDVFLIMLVRYAAVGLVSGGVLLLIGLLYRDERRWPAAIAAGYDYGLFVVFMAALPALLGYWQNGLTVRWYLPDLGLVLLHLAALVQVSVVAVLAVPLPWLVALLAWGVGRWRTYSQPSTQTWDPIARLRRR